MERPAPYGSRDVVACVALGNDAALPPELLQQVLDLFTLLLRIEQVYCRWLLDTKGSGPLTFGIDAPTI